MPTIDLGSVVGPRGEQGNTGPQGPQGVAGPSLISTTTQTTLTGVLAGDGSVVGVRAVDASPTANSTNLAQSGGVKAAIDNAYQRTCNQNLLDNWYFVGGGTSGNFPINQRGYLNYDVAGYTIDRWYRYNSGNITFSIDYVIMQSPAGANAFFRQILPESTSKALAGKTVTFSIYCALRSSPCQIAIKSADTVNASGSSYIEQIGSSATIASGITSLTVTLPSTLPHNCLIVEIYCGAGTHGINLYAAKLEVGNTQTLCRNDGTSDNPEWTLNEIPNYQQELAKCQRYFWNALPASGTYLMFNGLATSTSLVSGLIPTPVPMRSATPTISATINWFRGNGGSITTYTAPTTGSIIAGGVHTEIACSGVAASYPYYALFTQFQVSCEL